MPKYLFRSLILLAVAVVVFGFSLRTLAHSGGTDSQGGHNGPDGYHYHHGYPPHQHPNGECPYDFQDNVDHSDRSSSSSTSRSSSLSDDSTPWYVIALAVFALFFLSFGVPSLLAVYLGKDEKSVGCLSWVIFLVLLLIISLLFKNCIL